MEIIEIRPRSQPQLVNDSNPIYRDGKSTAPEPEIRIFARGTNRKSGFCVTLTRSELAKSLATIDFGLMAVANDRALVSVYDVKDKREG